MQGAARALRHWRGRVAEDTGADSPTASLFTYRPEQPLCAAAARGADARRGPHLAAATAAPDQSLVGKQLEQGPTVRALNVLDPSPMSLCVPRHQYTAAEQAAFDLQQRQARLHPPRALPQRSSLGLQIAAFARADAKVGATWPDDELTPAVGVGAHVLERAQSPKVAHCADASVTQRVFRQCYEGILFRNHATAVAASGTHAAACVCMCVSYVS